MKDAVVGARLRGHAEHSAVVAGVRDDRPVVWEGLALAVHFDVKRWRFEFPERAQGRCHVGRHRDWAATPFTDGFNHSAVESDPDHRKKASIIDRADVDASRASAEDGLHGPLGRKRDTEIARHDVGCPHGDDAYWNIANESGHDFIERPVATDGQNRVNVRMRLACEACGIASRLSGQDVSVDPRSLERSLSSHGGAQSAALTRDRVDDEVDTFHGEL